LHREISGMDLSVNIRPSHPLSTAPSASASSPVAPRGMRRKHPSYFIYVRMQYQFVRIMRFVHGFFRNPFDSSMRQTHCLFDRTA
jgi:hypothetical protein